MSLGGAHCAPCSFLTVFGLELQSSACAIGQAGNDFISHSRPFSFPLLLVKRGNLQLPRPIQIHRLLIHLVGDSHAVYCTTWRLQSCSCGCPGTDQCFFSLLNDGVVVEHVRVICCLSGSSNLAVCCFFLLDSLAHTVEVLCDCTLRVFCDDSRHNVSLMGKAHRARAEDKSDRIPTDNESRYTSGSQRLCVTVGS